MGIKVKIGFTWPWSRKTERKRRVTDLLEPKHFNCRSVIVTDDRTASIQASPSEASVWASCPPGFYDNQAMGEPLIAPEPDKFAPLFSEHAVPRFWVPGSPDENGRYYVMDGGRVAGSYSTHSNARRACKALNEAGK